MQADGRSLRAWRLGPAPAHGPLVKYQSDLFFAFLISAIQASSLVNAYETVM